MRIVYLASLLLILTAWAKPLDAQMLDPIDVTYAVYQIDENKYDVVFTADIDDGWYTYSQHIDDPDGPLPTLFYFEEVDGAEFADEVKECGESEVGYDQFFEMELLKFKDRAVFIHRVVTDNPDLVLTGYYEYMACDDSRCLPPMPEDFEISLSDAIAADEVGYSRDRICEEELPTRQKDQTQTDTEDEEATFGDQFVVRGLGDDEDTVEKDTPQADDEVGMVHPVSWTGEMTDEGDGVYSFVFEATIDEGWAIYSHELERQDGPRETTVKFDPAEHFEIHSHLTESGSNIFKGYDQFFEMDLTKLEDDARYEISIRVLDDEGPEITGFIEYMACDPTMCLPPSYVDFSLDPSTGEFIFSEEEGKEETVRLEAGPTRGEGTPVFFEFDYEHANTDCVGTQVREEDTSNFWWVFIAGFIGGLIAILTPCVFPMIPLTVSFFTKSSTTKAAGLKNAIIYGLSIIVIYVLLGLAITGIFGAEALNLLSTNAWFNIFFAVLFIVFAISFFGYFELTLPSSWVNTTDAAADQGGLIGIFFMAFTLSLVSFSCTGPIIGTLLVETATGGGPTLMGRIPVGPMVGMFGFSLALALPFGLFAAFPGWLNSMPKSGGWMNNVKVSLGFVEIALALKFLSIADLTMGWKILPYEAFLILWIGCAVGMALYFLGYIQFPHDTPVKRLNKTRISLATVMFALAVYIALGFRVSEQSQSFNTPNLLSGLAPPAGHSYIFPNTCPLNLDCFKDFEEGIEYAKKNDKPVLIDFTGHGCVNCRRMEDQVWKEEEIYRIINEEYVLISLYVDERTPLEETYVSAFSNREMRFIGMKWADFQAIHFNRNSQPYYVLATADGTILNRPIGYQTDRDLYREFLQCGLDRFEELRYNGYITPVELSEK